MANNVHEGVLREPVPGVSSTMAARVNAEKMSLLKKAGYFTSHFTKGTLQILAGEVMLATSLTAGVAVGVISDFADSVNTIPSAIWETISSGKVSRRADKLYTVEIPRRLAHVALLTMALGGENIKSSFQGKETDDLKVVRKKLKHS